MELQGQAIYAKAGEWIVGLERPRPTFSPDGELLDLNIEWAGPTTRAPELQASLDRLPLEITFGGYAGSKDIFLARTPASVTLNELRAALQDLEKFSYVGPNAIDWGSATVPNDTRFVDQFHLNNTGQSGGAVDADIDAPEAWDINQGYSGTVVGVIDTGITFGHPDLADNLWTNSADPIVDANNDGDPDDDGNGFPDDWRGWDFVEEDNDSTDVYGHGTAVSGVIGAVGNNGTGVSGVAWHVGIMPLRAGGADGTFSILDETEAIQYATMMRNRGVNIRVTNNSYGGYTNDLGRLNAIVASGDAGMLFVASAGNDQNNNDTNPAFPASHDEPNIVSVAATDRSDNFVTRFSNFGATSVDLGAAGDEVLTTVKTNDDPTLSDIFDPSGYLAVPGTSFAAPQVAGVAALAFTVRPEEPYQTIRDAILNGVDVIPSLNDPDNNPATNDRLVATGGRLNARRTLELMNPASLTVNGDLSGAPTNDPIIVRRDPLDTSIIQALVNGVEQSRMPSASVINIAVHGLWGDDLLQVDPAITVPARMIGDVGTDRLEAGSGNDVLYGGADNDVLYGGDGNDFHDGQWGDDFHDGKPATTLSSARSAPTPISAARASTA